MWPTYALVGVAIMGIVYMLWFLVGLLRAPAPSVWYWIVPKKKKTQMLRVDLVRSRATFTHAVRLAPNAIHQRPSRRELMETECSSSERQ
jgi:hypothetical protein